MRAIPAWAFVWLGRFLLALTALLLAIMPLTEHFWTWDRFLHGGQDFELGTLMVLSVLALVLVLSKHGKQCMDVLLAAWRFLGFHGAVPCRAGNGEGVVWRVMLVPPVAGPEAGNYCIPLQI